MKDPGKVKYSLNPEGSFIIENYNNAKPFASFFPGIAGKYGIPMWVFYVNRGQCICSFGTKDKDHAILEFFPANKSWQLVSRNGFRTFIKKKSGKKASFYEPFNNPAAAGGYKINNRMRISSAGLSIEEDNLSLGLNIKVEYFNIPNDTYAGLSRVVSIKNCSTQACSLQVIDGLPQIVPFGANNFFLKKMGRTIEAWMNVENLQNNVPFYKLLVDPSDRPEVVHIKEGNFYLGFHFQAGQARIIKPIVDPESVFGQATDFSYPAEFIASRNFAYPREQLLKSKTPSSLLCLNFNLKPGESKTFYAVSGNARDVQTLNSSLKKITAPGYLGEKQKENNLLIAKLQQDIHTQSGCRQLDLYAKQTYIDNIMRGGYPLVFESKTVFYLYSRKHGDLERDYNKFQLQPTYFSQGNGNYRDMNQNRRMDVWFNPQIKEENLAFFISLIQTDGFNPLLIKGESFMLNNREALETILGTLADKEAVERLRRFLEKPFSPGELALYIEENKIKLSSSCDDFLDKLLGSCIKYREAEHGEGFWSDHWTYNLDLIESYLGVYPEKTKEIFFEKRIFTFYDNIEIVRARSEKYLLHNRRPRQLHSLAVDSSKREMLQKRSLQPHALRTQYGHGEIYYSTLINKLFCLAANKISSLDPFGTGIEMEANKPNWFDALNGLPALFGSSTCETFELKRLLLMLKSVLQNSGYNFIPLSEEVADFISGLIPLFGSSDFKYWDMSSSLKEGYREKTRLGLSGKEKQAPAEELFNFLDLAIEKTGRALEKAFDQKTGLYRSYFINEVVEYDILREHYIKPRKFLQKPLPLFLEGQMHALRGCRDQGNARLLYKAAKRSALFDKKLRMYKVTASLKQMPEEIGRCRIFTPGWLENESIWLHMEYKYILELIKQGLYEEFYAELKNILVPFQKAQVYGRSILENSSFIVSSAFPDRKIHGNGFVARLSGSTAEFLQIWLLMSAGRKPFTLDNNANLCLGFNPRLAGWLFDRRGNYSFNFLSQVLVNYHNPKRKDTFGRNAAVIKRMLLWKDDDKPLELNSPVIPSPYSEAVRSRKIKKIDIFLE